MPDIFTSEIVMQADSETNLNVITRRKVKKEKKFD